MGCGASQPKVELLDHAPVPSPRDALASAPAAGESNGGGGASTSGPLPEPEAPSAAVCVALCVVDEVQLSAADGLSAEAFKGGGVCVRL